ncbi:hypothetical protein K502DRAFT_345381 [Neoconidiobolus thromboides FSU 785]|nr:hypothetical protein K502DRAFT_345381 [Neoconidiobolus thromboides FSU 785]
MEYLDEALVTHPYKCMYCQANRLKCNKAKGCCDKCLRRNLVCKYDSKPPRSHRPKDIKLASHLNRFSIVPKTKKSNKKSKSNTSALTPEKDISSSETMPSETYESNGEQNSNRHSISFLLC